MKFRFTKETAKRLAASGQEWDKVLFDACLEAGVKKIPATLFCEVLRASGFRCGTGPARAAYKSVRDGADIKGMIAAITAVKAKRKASDKGADTDTDKGAADTGADTDTVKAGKVADTGTLVGALQAAVNAAGRGDLMAVEAWMGAAQALLDTAKLATAEAIERMGGVPLAS